MDDGSVLQKLTLEYNRLTGSTLAASTRKAYQRDWNAFSHWCVDMQRDPMPASAETLLLYITHVLETRKITSARRYIAAIHEHHRLAGHPPPGRVELRQLIEGAERLRREQPRQTQPVSVEHLRAICSTGDGVEGVRDRAILTLGFSSALRRSNIVALDLADVSIVSQGLLIKVHSEKQDQKGKGRTIGVARGSRETCPVRALEAWVEVRGQGQYPVGRDSDCREW